MHEMESENWYMYVFEGADAEEYNYWLSPRDAAKNCQTPDVDSDSITDYQEVFGYNVKVITGWGKDNTPISKEITMYGNPLAAYKQTDGRWTDTDEDGIPDIVEIYFSNVSYIDNNSLWQQMIVSNGFASAYGWCREYYQTLNASDPSKAENWTQKAFNPFVVCNLPPMVTIFGVTFRDWWVGTDHRAAITVQCDAKALGFVKEVKYELIELCFGKITATETIPFSSNSVSTGRVFYVDYSIYQLYGYRVRCTVKDYVGYEVKIEGEVKGSIAQGWQFIATGVQALLGMLGGGLQNVWKAISDGVNTIVEWCVKKFEEMINPVIEALARNAYGEIMGSLNKRITEAIASYTASFDSAVFSASGKGIDDITAFFKPLISKLGEFTLMISVYSTGAFFREIERATGIVMVKGLMKIVRGIIPVPEIEGVEENWIKVVRGEISPGEPPEFIKQLDGSSKERLISSIIRYYKQMMGMGLPISLKMEQPKQNQLNKFAVIISEGGVNTEGHDITAAVQEEANNLLNLVRSNGYTIIGNGINYGLNADGIRNLFMVNLRNALDGINTDQNQILIVFIGHGALPQQGGGSYFVAEGNENERYISWKNIAEWVDGATLNGNTPKYQKMVIIGQSCFSAWMHEPLTQKHADRKVVISAAGFTEIAKAINGINRIVFLGHFLNFLAKDGGKEGVLTFVQVFVNVLFLCLVGEGMIWAFVRILLPTLPFGWTCAYTLAVILLESLFLAFLLGVFTGVHTAFWGGDTVSFWGIYAYARALTLFPGIFSSTPSLYNSGLANLTFL